MRRPVARHMPFLGPAILCSAPRGFGRRAGIVHGTNEAPSFDHRVEHDLEVQRVQLIHDGLRVGEIAGMPGELAVPRVPSGRRELGPEVDHRVNRQAFLAERARPAKDFVRTGERAMRLHVARAPAGGELGSPGDPRVLSHDHRRVARRDDKHIEWSIILRRETALGACEIEPAVRHVNEQAPAIRPDEPLDRRPATVRCQLVATLAVAHLINRALAVELRAALAQAKEGTLGQEERNVGRGNVENQPLRHARVRGLDGDRGGLRSEADGQLTCLHRGERLRRTPSRSDAAPAAPPQVLAYQGTVHGERTTRTADEGENGDTHGVRADSGDRNLDRPAGDDNVAHAPAEECRRENDPGTRRSDVLERLAPRDGHRLKAQRRWPKPMRQSGLAYVASSPQTPTTARGSAGPTAPAPRGDTSPPPNHGSAAHHAAASAANHRAWSGTSADPAESPRASAGSRLPPRSRGPASRRIRTPPPQAPTPGPRASARPDPPALARKQTPLRRRRATRDAARVPSTGNSAVPKPRTLRRPRPERPIASRRPATRASRLE